MPVLSRQRMARAGTVTGEPTLITRQGLEVARAHLKRLKDTLKEMTEDVAELFVTAGDGWHDNPQWLLGTQRRETVLRHIRKVEDRLSTRRMIEELPHVDGVVSPGCIVGVLLNGEPADYTILGPFEANPSHGIISNESPIARLLIGMREGDAAEFRGRRIEVRTVKRWVKN